MSNNTEALISRAKHIIENGGLLARDTSLALIAALEQSHTEREEFRHRLKLERAICSDNDSEIAKLRARIAELEAENLTSSNALLDAGKRIADLEAKEHQVRPVMFIDGDISPADADKLVKVIQGFNDEEERPLAKMARIIRENPNPTNECDKAIRAAGGTVQGDE